MALADGAYNKTVANVNPNDKVHFPNLLDKQPYWMSFSFYKYSMPSVTDQAVYYADRGTIRLPLPNNMIDDQHVQYSQEGFNLLTGAAVNQLQKGNAIAGGLLAGSQLMGGKDVAGIAGNRGVEALAQMSGVAANPWLTVMFKQPNFKQHALEWKLTPSNEKESLALNKIINIFKANMLPDQNGTLGGTTLTYPNIVQITVNVNSKEYFTYEFKPAVIESFSVNYTPGGQPSFFGSTKAPTEATIRLGLMEIEYWLSSDYGMRNNASLTEGVANIVGNLLKGVGL
jgi:hypothetical protein